MASVLDEVRGLIERLSPERVCDEYVAERLQRSKIGQANKKTRELAGFHGFEQKLDVCSLCGAPRTEIRQRVG